MQDKSKMPPVAVVGAGIAGLTAAHALRRAGIPVIVFEAGKQIAGLAKSHDDPDGFSYDFGAHFITNRLAAAIGVSSQCRDVRYYGESVHLGGKIYSYPFGLLKVPRFFAGGVASKLPSGRGPICTAADAFRANYGKPLADEVALPIVEAWSGAPASELSAAVAGKFKNSIPYTAYLGLMSRIKGKAISCGYSNEMPENPSVWHVYPKGGVALLCEKLAEPLRDVIQVESPVEQIGVEDGQVKTVRVKGVDREVSAVISTAPVPILAKLVTATDALKHLQRFRYRPMVFVNLRINKRGVLPDTVLWTPEKGSAPFFRLTETPLSMPWLAPAGKTLITADIGCEVGSEYWTMNDDALGETCFESLAKLYPGVRNSYLGCRVLRTPIAYPVFLSEYEGDRQRFETGTGIDGLISIGRQGEFAHILMEDIYWRTQRRVSELVARLTMPEGSVASADGNRWRAA